MHLCCRESSGDRGHRAEQGLPGAAWSCLGAEVAEGDRTGRTRCLYGVTEGRGRTAAHGQDRRGGWTPNCPWPEETPNYHIQASPARPPQDKDPQIPRAAQLQQHEEGHKARGSEALPHGWPGFRPPGLGVFWFLRLHSPVPSSPSAQGPSPAPGVATWSRNPAEDEEHELGKTSRSLGSLGEPW